MRRREFLAMFLAAARPSEAAVALDRRTGRVVAMRNEAVATRVSDPPGSTMKPLALTALLRAGKLRADESWLCPGVLSIAGKQLNCSHPRMAAPMTVETALAYSCNCFVAHVAERLGPGEFGSTVDQIRLHALGEDGARMTVVQLAQAYRGLAANAPAAVVAGLVGAVEYGTAQRAAVAGVKVAGKTGSVRTASGMRVAWFAGWTPEVAIAVRVQGRSGGADAAPVAAEMLRGLR